MSDIILYTSVSDFVAQLTFTSTLTNGGGQGLEGYALTTFHAAIRAIASIDIEPSLSLPDEAPDDEEFFDALSN